MTTPRITASALASPTRGKTFTIEAERRRKECQERLERFPQRVCARRGQPLRTKARLVPVTEYRVMAAAPGHRLRLAVAHRVVQILAKAAPATRPPRPARAG